MSILVMHDDDREFTESFNKNFANFVEPCNVYNVVHQDISMLHFYSVTSHFSIDKHFN